MEVSNGFVKLQSKICDIHSFSFVDSYVKISSITHFEITSKEITTIYFDSGVRGNFKITDEELKKLLKID